MSLPGVCVSFTPVLEIMVLNSTEVREEDEGQDML